ncbi:MAG: hypothetical protein ACHP65_06050 [Legionellales bacterium]
MSIQIMYQQAMLNDAFFLSQTGVERSDYQQLLCHFNLKCPKKLNQKEKLFAILHAKHYQLDGTSIGKLTGYVKAKRDGAKFLQNANTALARAHEGVAAAVALGQANPQAGQSVPELETDVRQKKSDRKKTTFRDNKTISIGQDAELNEVLDPGLIVEHAQRRVDLFFYMLIAYYKTQVTAQIDTTVLQHGIGTKTMPACHSAILPAICDSVTTSAAHAHVTRTNPGFFNKKNSMLHGTHFQHSLNSTIALHASVNYFDTHYIEGRVAEDKMRNKSIQIVNRVSQGELDPIAGTLQFLTALRSTFDSVKDNYFSKHELVTSPKETRALIFNSQVQGSFQHTWHENKGMSARMNDDYVHCLLRLLPHELEAIQQRPEETSSDYSARFFLERAAIYETKYESIAQEIKCVN